MPRLSSIGQLVGSSLLFVYDDTHCNVTVLDYGKTVPHKDPLQHDIPYEYPTDSHEEGYLIGLDNIIDILSKADLGTGPPPHDAESSEESLSGTPGSSPKDSSAKHPSAAGSTDFKENPLHPGMCLHMPGSPAEDDPLDQNNHIYNKPLRVPPVARETPSSFIESPFASRVDYDAWVAKQGWVAAPTDASTAADSTEA